MRSFDYQVLCSCLQEGDINGSRLILKKHGLRAKDVRIILLHSSGQTLSVMKNITEFVVPPRFATRRTLAHLINIENQLDKINSFVDKQEEIKNAHVGR
jgi:hypothetical protein